MGLDQNIRAVVFDFDGTLFDLAINWEELKNSLDLKKSGLGLGEAIQHYHKTQDAKLDVVTNTELDATEGKLLDAQISSVIQGLLDKNYKIAVFSRNSSKAIENVLRNSGLSDSIYVVGREEVRELKPHKEGLELILERYKVSPGETVLVGDTFHDIDAGHAAGVKVIIIANQRNNYQPEGADAYISNLSDVINELEAETT